MEANGIIRESIKAELIELNTLIHSLKIRREHSDDPFPWDISLAGLENRRKRLENELKQLGRNNT